MCIITEFVNKRHSYSKTMNDTVIIFLDNFVCFYVVDVKTMI